MAEAVGCRFAVAQLGARMHYAVPRILSSAGMLDALYTDIIAAKGIASLVEMLVPTSVGSSLVARLKGRLPVGIPLSRIVQWPRFAVDYYWRRRRAASTQQLTDAYLWAGRELCGRVIRLQLGDANAVYAFNSAARELLYYARCRGLFTVLEQTIAPAEIEDTLLTEELERHVGWGLASEVRMYRKELVDREKEEWNLADLIMCGSTFVRDSIGACGGPIERCVVVPYGFDGEPRGERRYEKGRRLRVLTIGAASLRKGLPYVLEASRQLEGSAEFRWTGSISVGQNVIEKLNGYVDMRGGVPRSKVREEYAWADVFLLPSICEGSATVVYEALAAGLPVITTPNCGSVVRDGVDGFVIPIRNVMAIVEKIVLLQRDCEMRAWMSANALNRSSEFTVERYGARLLTSIREGSAAKGGTWR